MPLTELKVRLAKPQAKSYKVSDEKGMHLLVNPNGSKLWRLKYRVLKKEKLLALGAYPDTSLASARVKRDEARKHIANGIDPMANKRAQVASSLQAAANSFEVVTREWLQKKQAKWVPSHSKRIARRFELDVFPHIGTKPIEQVTAAELLKVLRRMEARGVVETAHRIQQNCGQIFRYAIATGRTDRDIAADLRGALETAPTTHHASITDPKAVGDLLRAIGGYRGATVTLSALKLAPLLFLRPGELRHAEWSEIDLEAAEFRVSASKMKMRTLHIVPLAAQAVEILQSLKVVTGQGRYVFPSVRTSDRPMSENTVNAALRRLGYPNDEMTGHGFRSMASTLLNEHGWKGDVVERQLAHAERNNVRAAYNYAEYLPERRKMMQWWADYLDQLTSGAKIISIDKHKQAG